MPLIYLSPPWFSGFAVLCELLLGIITLLLSIFAFKTHRIISESKVKLFGIAFLFISLSYFTQFLLNFLIFNSKENLAALVLAFNVGVYLYMLLRISGLVVLFFTKLRINATEVLLVLVATSLLSVFLSRNPLQAFYLMSSVYLAFISWHFIKNCLVKKQLKIFVVAAAFVFLILGNLNFLFSITHPFWFVPAHALELLAYLLILVNFYLVLKK